MELGDETLQELNLPEEGEEDDGSRRAGDVTIYIYYFRAVGWLYMGIFVFSNMAFVLGITFPRKWFGAV